MQGSSGRAEIQKEVLATVENRINLVRRWKRKILLGPDVVDALSVQKPIEWYLGFNSNGSSLDLDFREAC